MNEITTIPAPCISIDANTIRVNYDRHRKMHRRLCGATEWINRFRTYNSIVPTRWTWAWIVWLRFVRTNSNPLPFLVRWIQVFQVISFSSAPKHPNIIIAFRDDIDATCTPNTGHAKRNRHQSDWFRIFRITRLFVRCIYTARTCWCSFHFYSQKKITWFFAWFHIYAHSMKQSQRHQKVHLGKIFAIWSCTRCVEFWYLFYALCICLTPLFLPAHKKWMIGFYFPTTTSYFIAIGQIFHWAKKCGKNTIRLQFYRIWTGVSLFCC